jgi:hypothetical protein
MPQSEEETDKTCGSRNYLHQSSVIHDGRDSETRLEVMCSYSLFANNGQVFTHSYLKLRA